MTDWTFFHPLFWVQPITFAVLGFLVSYGALFYGLRYQYASVESYAIQFIGTHLGEQNRHWLQQWLNTQLSPEFLESGITKFLNAIKPHIQSPHTLRRIYRYGDEWTPVLFQKITTRYLNNLDHCQREKIKNLLTRAYEQLFSHAKLEYHQAEVVMDVIFGTFLTPEAIRQMLLDSLQHMPSDAVERVIKQQLSGIPGMLVKFVDLKPAIDRFKVLLAEDPHYSTGLILQIIDQLEIREKLAEKISSLNWNTLQESERKTVSDWLNQFLDEWLQDDPQTLANLMTSILSGSSRLFIRLLLQTDWISLLMDTPQVGQTSTLHRFIHYIHPYLMQQLEKRHVWKEQIQKASNYLTQKVLASWSIEKRRAIVSDILHPIVIKLSITISVIGLLYGLLANVMLFPIAVLVDSY